MNKEQFIEYLQYRIECVQAYLRDLYSTNPNDIEVIKAEVELQVFEEILGELKDD